MKKDNIPKVLNSIIIIGIAITFVILIAMPLILTTILKVNPIIVGNNVPMKLSLGIYMCAIPYLLGLFLAKKLSGLIADNKPFAREIPIYLKRIGILAFSEVIIFNIVQIILCYGFDIYLYGITIMLVILVTFVSIAIGFLAITMSRLFEMAIEIKEENDATI